MFKSPNFILTILTTMWVGVAYGQSPEEPKQDKLVADLVAKGDAAGAKDQKNAHWAYTFALLYAPKDAKLAEKRKALGTIEFNASESETKQMFATISNLSIKDLMNWPDSTPAVELIELRILLDSKLVGDLRNSNFFDVSSGVNAMVFTNKPDITVKKVRETYGKPTAEKTYNDGGSLLTFGRVRIVGDKNGSVVGVCFRPIKP